MRPLPLRTPSWTSAARVRSASVCSSITENFSSFRGGLGGFLVFGAEPRGLGQHGAAERAVDEHGGHGVWFWEVALVIDNS